MDAGTPAPDCSRPGSCVRSPKVSWRSLSGCPERTCSVTNSSQVPSPGAGAGAQVDLSACVWRSPGQGCDRSALDTGGTGPGGGQPRAGPKPAFLTSSPGAACWGLSSPPTVRVDPHVLGADPRRGSLSGCLACGLTPGFQILPDELVTLRSPLASLAPCRVPSKVGMLAPPLKGRWGVGR